MKTKFERYAEDINLLIKTHTKNLHISELDQIIESIEDIVFNATWMDSPGQLAQPLGEIKDWRNGETEPIPGKTWLAERLVKHI